MLEDDNPGGRTLWACDKIPTPANGWQGQNYPGWCNAAATAAIVTATDTTKTEAERKAAYGVVIDQIAADVPALPLFFRWDYDARAPSSTLEHLDFNLETFAQEAEVAPAEQTVLETSDYAGNAGRVIAPAGALGQATSLSYYPLVAPAKSAPEGDSVATPFRLRALAAGVPQVDLQPTAPLTVTVRYQDAGIPYLDEATLDLYWWDAAMGWREAGETCAESDRYRSFDRSANTFTIRTCRLGEFTLLGDTIPYWPLAVGTGWRYAWNNTQYAPGNVSETVWMAGKSATQYRVRATGGLGDTSAVIESASGYEMPDITTQAKVSNPFPKPMYTLLSYVGVTSTILPGQWQVGAEVTGYAYMDGVDYETATKIVSNTDTVGVQAGSFADCLQIETVISPWSGQPADYVTGTRTLWFAPEVGLVKMVYRHAGGSVTTAELVETVSMPVLRLPAVRGK